MLVWCRLTDTGHYGRLRAEPALKLAQLVSCVSACLEVGIVFTVHDVIARSRNIVLYMVESFLDLCMTYLLSSVAVSKDSAT